MATFVNAGTNCPWCGQHSYNCERCDKCGKPIKTKKCHFCNTLYAYYAVEKYCPNCGFELDKSHAKCECGYSVSIKDKFCTKCGKKVNLKMQ